MLNPYVRILGRLFLACSTPTLVRCFFAFPDVCIDVDFERFALGLSHTTVCFFFDFRFFGDFFLRDGGGAGGASAGEAVKSTTCTWSATGIGQA